MLERLERARERAEAQAGREGATNDALDEALQRAIEALSEGDREAAAAALDRLAAQLRRMEGALERGRATRARVAGVSEQAEALARALQRARMGQDGESGEGASMAAGEGEGDGEGQGEGTPGGEGRTLSAAIANRLAALGLARSPATSGPGGSLRARGRALDALPTHGDAHARSQVNGEGREAIAAVAGVGANGEPTTEYRDVYPSYGVRVEEALSDERIPAARRRVVRRYFESIRPDAPGEPEEE